MKVGYVREEVQTILDLYGCSNINKERSELYNKPVYSFTKEQLIEFAKKINETILTAHSYSLRGESINLDEELNLICQDFLK